MQPCKVVQPKRCRYSGARCSDRTEQSIKEAAGCENIVSGEGKKVDYDVLAHRTQNEVARVAQINLQGRKGLPPLPVEPEEKLKKKKAHVATVPTLKAGKAKSHGEIEADAGLKATDSPYQKALKRKQAAGRFVEQAQLSLDNSTAREQQAGTLFGNEKKALVNAMAEVDAAGKNLYLRELD